MKTPKTIRVKVELLTDILGAFGTDEDREILRNSFQSKNLTLEALRNKLKREKIYKTTN